MKIGKWVISFTLLPIEDGLKSVFELNYIPLWGSSSMCGHRPEMEDSLMVVPHFMEIPIKMFIGDGIDMIRPTLNHLTSHFFGVYDGHGGSQVYVVSNLWQYIS